MRRLTEVKDYKINFEIFDLFKNNNTLKKRYNVGIQAVNV